jgi:hypothetical protein
MLTNLHIEELHGHLEKSLSNMLRRHQNLLVAFKEVVPSYFASQGRSTVQCMFLVSSDQVANVIGQSECLDLLEIHFEQHHLGSI